jgi:hypothetical protein
MSTLQVANLHLESTGNNRIQYAGSNTLTIFAGGESVLSANTTNKIGSNIGRQTIWVPAGAMTPNTTSGAAILNLTLGDSQIPILAFDTSASEYATFAIHMPKSWNEGNVSFQSVWTHPSTTTNFGVVWQYNARAYSNDDAPTSYTAAASSIDTGGTTNDIYISPESGSFTVEGTPAAEDLVMFRIFRSVSDGADNMAVDAYLIGVKIFYDVDAGKDN